MRHWFLITRIWNWIFQQIVILEKNMCGSSCTWLAVWQFVKSYWYDIGDAIAQLIDFGTDINNINVYSQACHRFKTQNISTFNESLQLYQNSNETESGSGWSKQVKDYVTNILGGDPDDWPMLDKYICQRRQCGYFYASIPPMIIPSLIMLGFVLANKRTRQLLDAWKILFILFSQITVPIYTLYLICRNQYKDELYQTLYALCTFLYIGESIPELIIK